MHSTTLSTDSYQIIGDYHVCRGSSNERGRMSVFLLVSRVFYTNVLQYILHALTGGMQNILDNQKICFLKEYHGVSSYCYHNIRCVPVAFPRPLLPTPTRLPPNIHPGASAASVALVCPLLALLPLLLLFLLFLFFGIVAVVVYCCFCRCCRSLQTSALALLVVRGVGTSSAGSAVVATIVLAVVVGCYCCLCRCCCAARDRCAVGVSWPRTSV